MEHGSPVRHPVLARLALLTLSVGFVWGVLSVKVFDSESAEKGRRSLGQLLTETLARRAIDANVGRFILLREHRPGTTIVLEEKEPLTGKTRTFRLAIDADGFIRPSRVHEKADVTVVFLGGSTTECALMDEELRFPYLAGRKLETLLTRRVNSYNGGVAGNETMHSIEALLGKVLAMRPDAVVLMEDINDLMILLSEGDYWYRGSFKSHLQTSREVFSPFERPSARDLARSKLTPERIPAIQAEFEANLETFVAIARARRVLPVLMTQENRLEGTSRPLAGAYAALNETTRGVASRLNVPLVDLAREIPHEERFVYDAVHLTPQGSRAAADAIATVLAAQLAKRR